MSSLIENKSIRLKQLEQELSFAKKGLVTLIILFVFLFFWHYDNTQNLISSLSLIGFFIIIFGIFYKNTKKAIKWYEKQI